MEREYAIPGHFSGAGRGISAAEAQAGPKLIGKEIWSNGSNVTMTDVQTS
ncbi:MAG: hypothetical protein WBF45_14920 [Acidobacteriaceae bacterium]